MVVAIDGPAGSGKSTVAKRCAEALGFVYVNSGKLYRAVTFKALGELEDPSDSQAVEELAERTTMHVVSDGVMLDGVLRSTELHTPSVDRWVSQHSAIPRVREIVNDELRRAPADANLMVEGRDIATVVFPDADVKIYLDADVETRARRRFEQLQGTEPLESLKQAIAERDRNDREKRDGALIVAPDAVYLDTSGLTIDDVCAKVLGTIQPQFQNQESQSSHDR